MAFKFCDSFDLYNTADIPTKWQGATHGCTISNSIFRTGTQSMFIQANAGTGDAAYSPAFPSTARFIVGCAINYQSNSDQMLCVFDSGSGTRCAEIYVNSGGVFEVRANGTVLGTVPATAPVGTWVAVGFDVTLSNSGAGTILVYINGGLVATFNDVNTGSPTGDQIILGQVRGSDPNGCIFYVDDFFLFDGTGSINNSYPGDRKIVALLPNGEGRVDNWTPNGATPNFACVNEAPPDGDTTYVSDSNVNDEDCYLLNSLPAGVNGINAVQVLAFARKDDSTTRAIVLGIGNGTSEDFGSDLYLSESYLYQFQPFDENPLTSAPWGVSDFTTLQYAVKVAV